MLLPHPPLCQDNRLMASHINTIKYYHLFLFPGVKENLSL